MTTAAERLRRQAMRTVTVGDLTFRIQRVNAQRLLIGTGRLLLPGVAEALGAIAHLGREEASEAARIAAEAKDRTRLVQQLERHPELLSELLEQDEQLCCAGVVAIQVEDDDGTRSWEPLRLCMSEEQEQPDEGIAWVYRLPPEVRAALAEEIRALSIVSDLRPFRDGAAGDAAPGAQDRPDLRAVAE